jgi:predicted ATPase
MARSDRRACLAAVDWVFFDRGLIDAAAALQHATGEPVAATLGEDERYHRQVFMTPPWPEIYVTDDERRHDLAEATDEYHRLLSAFGHLGYETIILPKTSVSERAEFVLRHLEHFVFPE